MDIKSIKNNKKTREEKARVYNEEIVKALRSMNPKDLQRFFNKYDRLFAPGFLHASETERKATVCKLICKSPDFKDTEQRIKAVSFLKKHGFEIPKIKGE